MEIRLADNGWSAEILHSASASPDGFWHVMCSTIGETRKLAFDGASKVKAMFCDGRQASIRAEPEAETFKDYILDQIVHKGFTRFSYKLDPAAALAAKDQ